MNVSGKYHGLSLVVDTLMRAKYAHFHLRFTNVWPGFVGFFFFCDYQQSLKEKEESLD